MSQKLNSNTPLTIGLKLLITIAVAETAIMLAFNLLHAEKWMSPITILLTDTLILSIIASTVIFFWVINPMKLFEEHKKAEHALKESEERYRLLFHRTPIGIFYYDTELRITECNDRFIDILQSSREKLVGLDMKTLKDQSVLPAIRVALAGDDGAYEGFYRATTSTTEIWVSMRTAPIFDRDGRISGGVGIVEDITERKKAEDAVRKSEEKFRTLFESANDAIFILDLEGNFIDLNSTAYERLGYTREEMLSKHVSQLDPPEFAAKVPERIEQIKKYGHAVFESSHVRKDGTVMPVEINARIIDFEGRKVLFSIIRDITERKKAEETLKETSQTLQSLIKSSPLAIIVVDKEGHVLIWNPAAEKMFGWNETEVLGRINPIVPEERLDEFHAFTKRVFKGESMSSVEVKRQRKDRSLIDVSLSTAPLRDAAGNIVAVLGILEDITKRKKMEEDLYQIKHDWEETFNSITDIVTVHDKDWNIIRANKAAEKILGLPLLDIAETKCFKYYHGRGAPPEGCPSCKCYKTKESASFEMFEPHLNMHIEIRAMPRFDSNNNLIGLIHIVRDITEKKKLEDQLRHAQKMEAIGTLTGGIAHDFNNILTAIIGYGSILKEKLKGDETLRTFADHLLTSSERAANLTQGLLAFSRKQIINPRPVDVKDIVKGVENLLSRIIGEDIELKTVFSDKKLTVMADAGQIEQVLMNLATNARDAMPNGGLLTIETGLVELDADFLKTHEYGKSGLYALISVTDTGTGMDEETTKRIFEPFFTTKELGKGTGLGLSIVYGIIKQHNGYINCYSEHGKGTTFKIYLPVITKDIERTAPAEVEELLRGKETILLVEDETEIRDLEKTVLEEFGYRVITAENGEDAVKKFIENKDAVQLLLLDVIMPKMNGKEAYEKIKKIKPDIKALFTSGYPADVIHKKGILEEKLNFVSKPIAPRDLLRKIREVLDR